MDHKDFVVVAVAVVFGMAGAGVAGEVGFAGGVVAGAGIAATWAHATDRAKHLEERVEELETEQE
ncbi:hypothetical protein [Halorussus halophilus]|uniref:hypothetical protein n=1 Tax=Halorussus halophilus TaxID=2650975 RepID=UPI0013015449|nr:hypothetical protein [Halorussus halophilus]